MCDLYKVFYFTLSVELQVVFSSRQKTKKMGPLPESLDHVDEERKQNIEAQEGVQGPRLK
jgi:hypothetical protein